MSKTMRHIKLDKGANGVATITLDNADESMNVVSAEWLEEMNAAIADLREDAAVTGVIITSGKPAFMAGADLKLMVEGYGTLTPHEAYEFSQKATAMHRALETMGKLQALHKPLFDAIHRDRKPLVNENAIAQFVASQGASADAFRQAYNSPAVDSKVERAKKLSRAYGISGVPSVIIAGKYRSSGSAAGSYGELLKVIDFLVDKERAGNRHVTAAP